MADDLDMPFKILIGLGLSGSIAFQEELTQYAPEHVRKFQEVELPNGWNQRGRNNR
jgi:hypothetical protein